MTSNYPVFALVAAVAFTLSVYHGTFDVSAWSSLAIATWWILLGGLLVGAWPRQPGRTVFVVGAPLLAFAVLSGLSGTWGESAEKAFVEANRVALYLGLFAFAAFVASRKHVAAWLDGLGAAAAAVAVVAVLSRLFRGLFAEGPLPTFLPYAHTRLSFPLDYWNGLAILVGLGVPLLLRPVVAGRTRIVRALALAPIPVIVETIYLASSRTGAVTLAVGVVVFVGLAEDRWAAVGALAAAATGSTAAIAWTVYQHSLVNGPLDSAAARSQGRWTALIVLAACALSVAAFYAGSMIANGRRPSRRTGRFVVAVSALGVAVLVLVSHPVRRFETFKQPPTALAARQYIQNHFLSTNGNYRWQYWTASVREFESHPFGGGAGSFEAWWAEHGTTPGFVRNAHSLYFEVLGELGVLGVLLLLASFGTAISVGAMRALRAPPQLRTTVAAATAGLAAYTVALGLDWMWQLTAVSVIGMVLLGLCVGPALGEERRSGVKRLTPSMLGLVALGAVVIVAEAVLLATDQKLSDSRAAARRGALDSAAASARSARFLQPWAATPRLQIALVEEQRGELNRARRSIDEAIHRDQRDWRLWLTAARIETKLGDVSTARVDLHRAIVLNPRSPVFARPQNGDGG